MEGEPYLKKHDPAVARSVLSPVDERDIWAKYDAKAAWCALERLVGSWSDVNTEKLAHDVSRWRKAGTRQT